MENPLREYYNLQENDRKDAFNFGEWIIQNELIDVKQLLIDYNMNTFHNLDINSNNFIQLTSDKRISEYKIH